MFRSAQKRPRERVSYILYALRKTEHNLQYSSEPNNCCGNSNSPQQNTLHTFGWDNLPATTPMTKPARAGMVPDADAVLMMEQQQHMHDGRRSLLATIVPVAPTLVTRPSA